MKLIVYSGSIPSTTFIERLILGLAKSEVEVFLHGRIRGTTNYDLKNIKVIGYGGVVSKFGLALKFTALFLFIRPRQLMRLRNCYLQSNKTKSFSKWFVQAAPIVWHKPDIFHLQWAKAIEDWIYLQDFGIKVVLSLRGAHINYSPIVDKQLEKSYIRTFPDVDAFHGVSKAICHEAQKYGAKAEKCKVVYSGLNLKNFPFQKTKSFDRDKIRIISVGRPHWKKGYDTALDAMKNLKDRGLDFSFKIIGGASEEILYQIDDLKLNDEVSVEKKLPFEKVKATISDSDILLLSSVEEGIPNVILEAMALGTIVISTDCGGVSEVVKDGENGFLVPLRDPLAISEKIEEVKNLSQEKLDKIRLKARATIERQNNHTKMIEDMKSLYFAVLQK